MANAKHTTVPFTYKASLEIDERISDAGKERQHHGMSITGRVHPDPYDMDTATALAREFLNPFVQQGWSISKLEVGAYGRL